MTEEGYLSKKTLLERYEISSSTLRRLIHSETNPFPQPVYLTDNQLMPRWSAKDVREWEAVKFGQDEVSNG